MSPLVSTRAGISARGYGLLGAVGAATDYESIQTYTVGSGGQASITFSSIPSTYKHLQVRAIALSSSAGGVVNMTVNGASSTYARHRLVGYGSGIDALGQTGLSNIVVMGDFTGTGATPTPAGIIIDLLDYADTNKNKTFRILSGVDRNGSGEIEFLSGLWASTTAVNQLTFTISGSVSSFAQYTQFALYGIKG